MSLSDSVWGKIEHAAGALRCPWHREEVGRCLLEKNHEGECKFDEPKPDNLPPSAKPETGGPAFPVIFRHVGDNGEVERQEWEGMTLRAYIATRAMQGILIGKSFGMNPPEMARMAVQMADALIAELSK